MATVELEEGEVLYLIHLLEPNVLKDSEFPFTPLYQKLYKVAQANLAKRIASGELGVTSPPASL